MMENHKLASAIIGLTVILTSACSVDTKYDITNFNEIDSRITLFQDGLDIPLGSTAQLHADSLFESFTNSGFLKYLIADDNGNYRIEFSGEYTNAVKSQSPRVNGAITSALPYNIHETATISLNDIPEQFKDIDLALNPTLTLEISTDFNIPVKGKITISPDNIADRTVTVDDIEFPYSEQEGTTSTKTIVIGRDVTDAPGHYTADLSLLISRIPDNLFITIDITDIVGEVTAEATGGQCSFEYLLDIPAKFENSPVIHSPLDDAVLNSEFTDFLSFGPVEINASGNSTMPAEISIAISLLDTYGNEIGLDQECSLTIPAGPTASLQKLEPLVFSLTDKSRKPVKMHFDMQVKPVMNKQFNKNQFIELLDMYLRLADGITIEKK